MAMSPIRIGATERGEFLVCVVGRATMQHSPATEELIVRTLETDPNTQVAVELTNCTYLDSTFLGCFFGLHRRYVQKVDGPPRLHFFGPQSVIKGLFGPLRLDKVLIPEGDAAAKAVGRLIPLEPSATEDRKALCRHVMECHRRLAATDSPAKAAFTKIADAMEKELNA